MHVGQKLVVVVGLARPVESNKALNLGHPQFHPLMFIIFIIIFKIRLVPFFFSRDITNFSVRVSILKKLGGQELRA